MPQALFETKFNSLIARLNELQDHDQAGLEFEIRKLKREAEKLKSADPAEAFAILGIIACFEGNIPEMHRCHKNALRHSGDHPLHLANYATSLDKCKLPEEALVYAKKTFEKSHSDLDMRKAALDMVIALTYVLGKLEEFVFYREKWLQLTGEKHPLTVLYDFSEAHGLSPHFTRAIKLLNDCFVGAEIRSLTLQNDPETEEEWLVIEFKTPGKIEDILDNYDRYTDAWISSVPWPEREKIRISYIAA